MEKSKNEKDNVTVKKIKITTLIYSSGLFVIFILLIFSLWIYRFNGATQAPKFIGSNIFLPAIIIDGVNFISFGDINQNLSSIKSFYENQDFSSMGIRFDFKTEEGKKRLKLREKELINKMIEDRVIEILAKDNGIVVSDRMVDDNVERKLNEYGNEKEVRESLFRLYGWSLGDFKDRIVKPSIYKEEMEVWLEENDGKDKNNASNERSLNVSEQLKSGVDFDSLAKQVSEGGTSDSGGRLGWFEEDQIVADIRNEVVELKVGTVSNSLESKLGYHIIKLNEIRENDGKKSYNISQIFFPKMSFAIWLDEEIKKMNVNILIADYNWNKEFGVVEFKNAEMKKFEEKSLTDAQRDASLLTF